MIAVAQAVELDAGGTVMVTAIEIWGHGLILHSAEQLPEFRTQSQSPCRVPSLRYSARRRIAVGVRAAIRAGMAATRLASTSAPIAMKATVTAGTVGSGTAWIA